MQLEETLKRLQQQSEGIASAQHDLRQPVTEQKCSWQQSGQYAVHAIGGQNYTLDPTRSLATPVAVRPAAVRHNDRVEPGSLAAASATASAAASSAAAAAASALAKPVLGSNGADGHTISDRSISSSKNSMPLQEWHQPYLFHPHVRPNKQLVQQQHPQSQTLAHEQLQQQQQQQHQDHQPQAENLQQQHQEQQQQRQPVQRQQQQQLHRQPLAAKDMNQTQHIDKSYVAHAGHYGYRVQQQLPQPQNLQQRPQRSLHPPRRAVTFQDTQYRSLQLQQQHTQGHSLYNTAQIENLETFGASRQQLTPQTNVQYFV
jgi:hypothetical protein